MKNSSDLNDVKVSVLGAGSWGTTLADLLGRKGLRTTLWVREAELLETMEKTGENEIFLPGVKISENVLPTGSLEVACRAPLIVCAVPTHGAREVFKEAARFISDPETVIVSASKGIEEETGMRVSEIMADMLPPVRAVVVLSGPSFAREVAMGKPTALCAASANTEAALLVQKTFSTDCFRVYTNSDVTGVELGGALKNIIAIASGICGGLGLGPNARAALITRGLAEMTRLGTALGARAETFSGLSGLGDLVLTCTDEMSRNYTVGLRVGRGEKLWTIMSEMKMVAEGVRTSRAVKTLAERHGVEMPITGEVCSVLYEDKDPRKAVMELMTRRLRRE
ncbi:MAG TPA: NAD(P)-dependent glycerol-3-phosphate dehydrogenase [Deltaproteobacteria bacterium]|nr:NAD(P)-dependent glycerol-3-phosphate dehydrogenase [Deltaproteobacteria bacterium]